MTLDKAIKENKEDLKIFIGYYEQKLMTAIYHLLLQLFFLKTT